MTKRSVIITTSILVGIVAIFTILFGMVFRVRDIQVVHNKDFYHKTEINQIIKDSKLRKNTGIFSVDRDKIAYNIEKAYPNVRVDSVNISSFTSVKIKLSNREPLYYAVEEAKYYILDEDCKVLEITNDAVRAEDYIRLENVFNVGDSVEVGDFLNGKYVKVCSNLYTSLYTYAVLNLNDGTGTFEDRYLEREDMCEVIEDISFTQVNELKGKVDKLMLNTSYGVKISIIEPQKDMGLKINMAFSALRTIIAQDIQDGTDLATSGTIAVRYSYDKDNAITLKCEYHI